MIEVGEKVTSVVTYTASGSVVVFGWLLSDISMLIAAVVAVLGFISGQYYKWQHLEIAKKKLAQGIADAECKGDGA